MSHRNRNPRYETTEDGRYLRVVPSEERPADLAGAARQLGNALDDVADFLSSIAPDDDATPEEVRRESELIASMRRAEQAFVRAAREQGVSLVEVDGRLFVTCLDRSLDQRFSSCLENTLAFEAGRVARFPSTERRHRP